MPEHTPPIVPPIYAGSRHLPGEVVTLCFTDIEDSTPLQERFPDEYASILMRHRETVRDAFESTGGLIVSAEGEEFFAVFQSASAGIDAAMVAQQALADTDWPGSVPVRVRMGLHTGSPIWTGHEYVGLDVVRASRVASAAYGGQILISGTTLEALGGYAPARCSILPLGIHRLKGLRREESIYQLSGPNLPSTFPPPRTVGRRAATLPVPSTGMIDREVEIPELHALLSGRATRLVTLSGPGGAGKTRLAIMVARQLEPHFEDGVCFVALAPLRTADGVPGAIRSALGLDQGDDFEGVAAAIGASELLLVLDNAEHVIDSARDVVKLIDRCPGLTVLVTSREPLDVTSGIEYRVEPLALPALDAKGAEIAASPAIQLYLQRAVSARPGLNLNQQNETDIHAICRRLDGLPLAIELVAARSQLLSPAQIFARLDHPLELATRGPHDVPERQQSLRAAIDWSYKLLPADQQSLFRQLAIFPSSFSLDTATAVTGDANGPDGTLDALQALVQKSLLQVREGRAGEVRFAMLETIRSFASDELDAHGEHTSTANRHLRWFRAFALRSSQQTDQAAYVAEMAEEVADLRAALSWALTHPESATEGLLVALSVSTYWWQRAAGEGVRWLEALIAVAQDASPNVRSRALYWLAFLGSTFRPASETLPIAEECLAAAALSGRTTPTLVLAMNILSETLVHLGDGTRAATVCTETVELARSIGDQQLIGVALGPAGMAAFEREDFPAARAAWTESCERFEATGNDLLLASPLGWLAMLALREGDLPRAESLLSRGLQLLRRTDDSPRMAEFLALIARVRLLNGQKDEARGLLRESIVVAGQTIGTSAGTGVSWGLTVVAEFAATTGRMVEATTLVHAAESLLVGPMVRAVARPEIEAIRRSAAIELSSTQYAEAQARGSVMTVPGALAFAEGVLE